MAIYYVSNQAAFDFALGSNSNNGLTKQTPFLTIAAAVTAASNGDSIIVNDGTYDQGSTLLNINKNVQIDPRSPFGAVLTGNNATAVVQLTAQNNTNILDFGAFVVSPTGGTASAASRGIIIAAMVGYDATVMIDGAKVASAANSAISDASLRGTTVIKNCIMTGPMGAQGWLTGLNLATTAHKTVFIRNNTTDGVLTATAGNTPPITYSRTVPSNGFEVNLTVEYNVINVNFPVALGTSATGRGIGVAGIKNAIVRKNKITLDSVGVTASDSSCISVTTSSTSAVADNALIEYNECIYNAPASRGIAIGDGVFADPGAWAGATAYTVGTFRRPVANNGLRYEVTAVSGTGTSAAGEPSWPLVPGQTVIDNAGANQITWTCRAYQSVQDCVVRYNKVINTFYNGSATPHGISVSQAYRGKIYGNYVEGNAVGIITSYVGGRIVRGNVIRGAYYCPLFAKGAGISGADVYSNNSIVCDDTIIGVKFGGYGAIGVAISGAFNNLALNVRNNAVLIANGAGWKHVVVDAAQVATFSGGNNYFSIPALTLPFSYQGTTYADLTAWKAARELGGLGLDPGTDFATKFAVTNTGLVERGVPVPSSAITPDYFENPFKNPPTPGAVEYRATSRRAA